MVKSINGYNLLDGVEFIKGKFEHFERDVYVDKTHLEKGRYFAFVEIDWHEATAFNLRDFSFNCYGIGKVKIKEVTKEIGRTDFLREAFIAKLKINRDGINRQDFD